MGMEVYHDGMPSMGETDDATIARPAAPQQSRGVRDEVRFTPGTMVASRYRIVSLLGAGGMGEVYRADDVRLGQRVALKYIPERLANDPAALDRLLHEVRIGRQISHPNVCRMYDLVEAEGHRFIAMEFVDGEDLASLLRRIGRLPADKAIAIARDVCAGLAAAHHGGVIHRDLKPANIMIDGRGTARITDFGLAVIAGDAVSSFEICGTPAYMAPEQLTGRGTTARSDIYALGLVLFEAFTGRRVFDGVTVGELRKQHAAAKTRPSSIVGDIDRTVERVILRCLEEDPAQRPPSANAVWAALPGGDPLQAAIAAGETPSPHMVAAAGATGDLPLGRAWTLLGASVFLLALGTWVSDSASITRFVHGIKSREALTDRARDVIRAFGYEKGVDSAAALMRNDAYRNWLVQHGKGWSVLSTAPPSPMLFFYRDSPQPLIAKANPHIISMNDPPRLEEGDTVVVLDHEGRLRRFTRIPPQFSEALPALADWGPAFREAGLDMARFTPVVPRWRPDADGDRRYAWSGAYSERPDVAVRVEAASLRGRPIGFAVIEPWGDSTPRSPMSVVTTAWAILGALGPICAALWAWHNHSRGRTDRRGAARVAAIGGMLYGAGRLLIAHHVAVANAEYVIMIAIVSGALYNGFFLWLAYVAVEPYVRRRWPKMLIGWMRLTGGRMRDPRVGAEVLIGLAIGTAAFAVTRAIAALAVLRGLIPPLDPLTTQTANAAWPTAYAFPAQASYAVLFSFGWLTLLLFLRAVTRSDTAAVVLVVVANALIFTRELGMVDFAMAAVAGTFAILVLRRVGVLAVVALLTTHYVLSAVPPGSAFVTALLLLAAAVYAFHVALGGKPLFGALTLEDEPAA